MKHIMNGKKCLILIFSASNPIEHTKRKIIKSKGSIIVIGSGSANKFIKGAPITYATAKTAITFYPKSLAHYLGSQGVKVNIIAPGNKYFKGSNWDKKIKKK